MGEHVTEAGGKTRLFVVGDLGAGMTVALDEGQTHYLLHVLRAKTGNRLLLFNGHDGELAREYFTPDVTFHALTVGTLTGVDSVVPVLVGLIDALSDIHAEVQDVIASDDLVALRQVVKARHTGTLLGMPPTGEPLPLSRVSIGDHDDALLLFHAFQISAHEGMVVGALFFAGALVLSFIEPSDDKRL